VIARLCLLLCALLLPPTAHAERPPAGPGSWPDLRWGMTEPQVLAALPGRAARLDAPETLADGRVVSMGLEHFEVGGVDFRVRFVFAQGKLALVALKNYPARLATPDDYDRLHALLATKLAGAGTEVRESSVVDYRQARWDAAGERVDLKYIPGQLVLQHSPPVAAAPGPSPGDARP
jgi:hypothetical protein